MDSTDQMRDPNEFALNWEALVSSTVDHARQAETYSTNKGSSDIFPPVLTRLEIRKVTFEEFTAYHPNETTCS